MGATRLSDSTILIAAGALAVALPYGASRYLDAQLHDRVEPALTAALGEEVSIDSVESSLTGSVRLEDVRVGGLFRADAIEASVGLASLLSGHPGADEIRMSGPRLRTRLDRYGETRLRRTIRRAVAARRKAAGGGDGGSERPGRLRRIVVTDGELRVDLEGRGVLWLHGVALHPQRGGVRVVASGVDLQLLGDGVIAYGRFGRTAADLSLPAAGLRRAVTTDGDLELVGRFPTTHLTGLAVTSGVDNAPLRAVATVADGEPGARVEVEIADGVATITGTSLPLAALTAAVPAWLDLRQATATGTAVLSRADGGGLVADIDASIADAGLDDPRIAPERLPLAGGIVVHALSDERGVRVTDSTVRVADVELAAAGALERDGGAAARGEVEVTLVNTPCMRVLSAVPAPARRRLAGLSATGDMSGRVHLVIDRLDPDATTLDVTVNVDGCRVRREATAADPMALRSPFEHAFPNGTSRMVGDGHPGYAPIESLPPALVGAFVAAEDARFFTHNGFDPRQIEASLRVDVAEGDLVRGGSTITQQLAKNVFLEPRRTFARKLEEAVLAWRLEARLSKTELLETYLNIIELGDGVYGVSDAARYWFGKTPRELSVREIAFLAVLTPAPRTISQRVRLLRKPDAYTAHRIDVVLRHMKKSGVINQRSYDRARRDRLSIRAPRLAQKQVGRGVVSGGSDVGMIDRK